MKRQRKIRCVLVRLDCGCLAKLFTGRFRVSRDLAAIIVGHAVRTGTWCHRHNGLHQPVEQLRVVSEDYEP